jgi:hypothetical protein
VGQHHILDRFGGYFPDALDHLACHQGGGLCIDHHHAIVTDDDAGIRIAFGREGPGVGRQALKTDLLRFQIAL